LHFAWFDMPGVLARLTTTINRAGQKPTDEPTATLAIPVAA